MEAKHFLGRTAVEEMTIDKYGVPEAVSDRASQKYDSAGLITGMGEFYFADMEGIVTSVITTFHYNRTNEMEIDIEIVHGVGKEGYGYRPITVRWIGGGKFLLYFKEGGVCPQYLSDERKIIRIDLLEMIPILYKGPRPIFVRFAEGTFEVR